MAVGISIHGSKLTTVAVILLGKERLVNLSTVLIRSRLNLEGTWVEILIHIKAVVPVASQIAIHIQREFLQSEMIALIVQSTIESFLTLLGERVHGITDITEIELKFHIFDTNSWNDIKDTEIIAIKF